ncbi:hypothetical protein [Yoonia sp. BS5-3]|uniref:FlgN protein n=1 Tax=Yoonia phaeophyticola TaxID=3137369 RepID=A0ABZ2V5Y4_9RHOB
MPDHVSGKMIELLDRERSAIRTADFDALGAISDEKVALFDSLATSGASRQNLAQIKRKVDENQTLLSAAISGVAAAQDRLSAVRHVREGLSIYDKSGQMAKVPTTRPGLEKKA